MKRFFAFSICIVFVNHALALKEIRFPKSTEAALVEKNLTEETIVKYELFSVAIPKGWSIETTGPSDNYVAGLTATPTSNIAEDETFIGIHVRRDPPKGSLDDRKLRNEKVPGRTVKFTTWNGHRWLLVEYSSDNAKGKKQKSWNAFTTIANIEIWMIAATPDGQVSKYRNTISKIMESIILTKK